MPIDVAADLDRILADTAGVSVAATYTPQGGASVALRLLRVAPAPVTAFADPNLGPSIDSFVLQAADVAAPAAGDTVEIGAEVFTLQGVPIRGAQGTTWRVEAWRGDPVVLDTEIDLVRATTTRNGFGENVPDWDNPTVLATVQAAFHQVGDDEMLRAGVVESRAMARFTIRLTSEVSGLTSVDRVQVGTAQWSITGIVPRGRDQWLEIAAEKVE